MNKQTQTAIKSFFTVFLMLGIVSYAHAQVKPKIRELNSQFLDIDENIMNTDNNTLYSTESLFSDSGKYTKEKKVVNAPILKGGISELRSVVGKSQIVRFDEPITKLSITNPGLVEMVFLSAQEILMNGLQGGETTVIIWGEDKEPVFFNLFVENDNYKIVEEIRKLAPNEKIEIDFIDAGSDSGLQIVLKGRLSSSILKAKIESIISAYGHSMVDLTETLEPQVLLEVRIIELGKSKSKNRGYEFKKGLFDYLALAESSGLAASTINLIVDGVPESNPWYRDAAWELLSKAGSGGGALGVIDDFKGSLGGTTYSSDGQFGFWKAFPGSNLAYKIKAAESEGLVKTLSEPRVMVVNNETATFNSGSQVPVPSGTDELGNVQYEYTNVGTQISITPFILEESERILLEISAKVSEIDDSLSSAIGPGLNTRESKTKVEIANNHTTVITGLVRKSETKTITKFPFLSNLPFIGKMFSSVSTSGDDTELMIFVTASIVKPDLGRGE